MSKLRYSSFSLILLAILAATACQPALADTATMPAPTGLSYQQTSPDHWTLTWNAAANTPADSSPIYEVEMLNGVFSGTDALAIIQNGRPFRLDQYVVWDLETPATAFISVGIPSDYANAIKSPGFRWVDRHTGVIDGVAMALQPVPGATDWRRVNDTYAVLTQFPATGMASLGAGVMPSNDLPESVERIHWGAIRARSADANGHYAPSDWTDLVVNYGVQLKSGHEYK